MQTDPLTDRDPTPPMATTDTSRLETEIAPIARDAGCELVHVDFKGGRLRVFLDREGGITVDDCQRVSKEISALLDVADWGPGRYVLEVSSPGLDRPLFRPADYERFTGESVRVRWRDPASGAKQTVVATLEHYEPSAGNRVTLVEANGNQHEITLKDIESARLEPQF